METDWIKNHLDEDNKLRMRILSLISDDEYKKIELKFLYKETEYQTLMSELDSISLTFMENSLPIIYKLYKIEQRELEFRRQVDIKQLQWLPHGGVLTERVIFYEDDYNYDIGGYIEYQYLDENHNINDDHWQPRASFQHL